MRKKRGKENMLKLNESQKKAVMHRDGPMLLLAGAGSGKTMTLVQRTVELLKSGVPEETILLLTFTNKAADEMKKRIEDTLDRPIHLTACTYHSFCNKMLRIYSRKGYIKQDYTVLTPSDEPDIIDMVKVKLHMEKERGLPPNHTIVNMISSALNKQKTLWEVVSSYPKYKDRFDDIQAISIELAEYKKENNLLNYDDILVEFRDMIQKHDEVRRNIERSYRYIMVDEYQDTNHLQEEIIILLRKSIPNIVVVGDDSQSLYAFRGADVNNIIDFSKKFNGCKTVNLMENYRSNQEILDVANHAINNHATEGFKKMLHGQHKKGELPKLYIPPDSEEEAWITLNIIKKSLGSGISPKEICVLARTSSEFAQIEILLTKEGIAYEKYGGQKFLEQSHIKDMLALLRIITNQTDEVAWYRALQLHPGIGQVYSRMIAEDCIEEGLEALDRKEKRKYVKWLRKFKEELEKSKGMALTPLINSLSKYYEKIQTEVIQAMRTKESMRSFYMEGLENAIEDFKVLADLSEPYKSINSFLDDLALDGNPQLNKSSEQMVLSTIHSVKGLEFDTVIILNCIDEVFPSTVASDEGSKDDNEELRCFYVAVTRAKNNLHIMCPEIYMKWGRVIYGEISHYIKDGLHLFSEQSANHRTNSYW